MKPVEAPVPWVGCVAAILVGTALSLVVPGAAVSQRASLIAGVAMGLVMGLNLWRFRCKRLTQNQVVIYLALGGFAGLLIVALMRVPYGAMLFVGAYVSTAAAGYLLCDLGYRAGQDP